MKRFSVWAHAVLISWRDAIRHELRAAYGRIVRHRWGLFIVVAAVLAGQYIMLKGQFWGGSLLDTSNYAAAARGLINQGLYFDPLRTPGYPGFLAIFLISGIPFAFFWVMVAQVLITVLTTLLVYVLTYRISRQQVTATIVTVLVATNPYILQWERMILSEMLSYWAIVTLLVVFEWHLRTRHPLSMPALVFTSILTIMIRPFNVYVPIVLFSILAITDLRIGTWRKYWRGIVAGVVVTYSVLVIYMAGNEVANHFFNLTEVTNVNLFGKVLEYRLYDQTSDPRYTHIKADVDAYVATTARPDPFYFIFILHPEYQRDGISDLGDYSRSILAGHLATTIKDTTPDLLLALSTPGVMYGLSTYLKSNGSQPAPRHPPVNRWRSTLQQITSYEFLGYDLLPLITVLVLVWWWREPKQLAKSVLAALALIVAGNILITGGLSYDTSEFSRLRSPNDWAILLLVVVVGARVFVWLAHFMPALSTAKATKDPVRLDDTHKRRVRVGQE
jgi:hypothetical protein